MLVQRLPEEPGQVRAHTGKPLGFMLILKQSNTAFAGMGASHWPDSSEMEQTCVGELSD